MATPAMYRVRPADRPPVLAGLAYAVIPALGLWALVGAVIWIA